MSDNLLRLVEPVMQEMSDEHMVYAIYRKVLSQVGSSAAKPVNKSEPSANAAPSNVVTIHSRR